MNHKKTILFLISILFASSFAKVWSVLKVPNPSREFKMCGQEGASFICNPDGVLKESTTKDLAVLAANLEDSTLRTSQSSCGTGYQMGFLVVEEMENPALLEKGELAKKFCKEVHDQWGVGDQTCNNGVMVLLSKLDRQIYISTVFTSPFFIWNPQKKALSFPLD